MSIYLITGASRGIGFEFVRQISANPDNLVVGLVRNKAATEKKVAEELSDRKNVHVVQGDLTNYAELKASVEETSKITGGSLDYIIANAGYVSQLSQLEHFSVLGEDPVALENDLLDLFKINVIGNVHLFNLYVPLILKGKVKKVITISSGLADNDFTLKMGLSNSGPYACSKAAMNVVNAKYSTEYSDQGVCFLSICPGLVETGHYASLTPHQEKQAAVLMEKFMKAAPHFKGESPPEEAVKAILDVTYKYGLETGHGGAFVSHHGDNNYI